MKKARYFLLITLILALTITSSLSVLADNNKMKKIDPWMEKPILNYLLMTTGDKNIDQAVKNLKETINLSDEEYKNLIDIAIFEKEQTLKLNQEIKKNKLNKSPQQYKNDGENVKNNKRLKDILNQVDNDVKELLGNERYNEFRNWLEDWWWEETNLRYNQSRQDNLVEIASDTAWVQVYATQYHGEYATDEVALPDKYLKYANRNEDTGGWPIPPSAYSNPYYTVSLREFRNGFTYETTETVWEVGPHNKDDNYWDSDDGSNPRRFGIGLGLGTPAAYAAYYYNWNDGLDQYGDVVQNPAGIDLTPSVAAKLGLGYLENAWIDVNVTDLP